MASPNQMTLYTGAFQQDIEITTTPEGIVKVSNVETIECVGQIALFGEGSIPTDRHLCSVN